MDFVLLVGVVVVVAVAEMMLLMMIVYWMIVNHGAGDGVAVMGAMVEVVNFVPGVVLIDAMFVGLEKS